MKRGFPNLFIIGAMKAGTSSLHEYLHQHPEIFMSRFKEPQYFAPHRTREGLDWGQGNPCPELGIGWYLRLFEDAGNVKYAGESSVSYTAVPVHTGCHERIYSFNPEARLIYIMRDPVERTISHYWHYAAAGWEDRDMLTAVRRLKEYVSRSDYAMQLKPYFDTFGRDRVYMLTLEELTANPGETLRNLFAWLGVDPEFPVKADEKFNVGGSVLRQTRRGLVPVDAILQGWRWDLAKRFLPGFVPSCLSQLVYRTVRRNEADHGPAIRYLRRILEAPTRTLANMVGREFPEWTTLYAARPSRRCDRRPTAQAGVAVGVG
jgi:hypothetical protein